jgi:hypothetical protein
MKLVMKQDVGQGAQASQSMNSQPVSQSMKQYAYAWVLRWCAENGWTDLFMERYRYWAFPPGAVMPQPIPAQVLQCLHDQHGASPIEQRWYGLIVAASALAGLLSCWAQSPLPLIAAFALCSLAVAYLDEDDLLGD